jgi:hypothetical protein
MDVAPDHQIVTVDGERFSVDYDPGQPGAYHFKWLSGRDPDYGFTTRASSHGRLPQQPLVDHIGGFLSQIDPATGYLAD